MAFTFQRAAITCLDPVIREVRSAEETQEIRLPDSLPDVGTVLACWGQGILRSKEWGREAVRFSGGMMVWVLYAPEDGSAERCIEGWIPFQMKWDLPEGTPEGKLRMTALVRSLDARSLSPRKLMVRAGMSVLGEAWTPTEVQIAKPEGDAGPVQLLQRAYPLDLYSEAGERLFRLEEELSLPPSAPEPEKLLYYRLDPQVGEARVLTDKLVFRGSGNLHVLYRSKEGQLHSWDFSVPFSQYAELEREHGTDSRAYVTVSPTGLEVELQEDGRLRLHGPMTGQYILTDRQLLNVAEDAYIPGREIRLQRSEVTLPVVLEGRRENLYAEQTLPAEANAVPDVCFYRDFPRQQKEAGEVLLENTGTFQVLYYAEEGMLRSGTARWEGSKTLPAGEGVQLTLLPTVTEPQAAAGNGKIQLKAELPMEMTAAARQTFPMITALEPGQPVREDPSRPSLILRRAGRDSLWDIAKGSGSTPDAIRRANSLETEPKPDQMLLIPVG